MRFLSADVGGTFTDLVLVDTEKGRKLVEKVPSGARGSASTIAAGIERITSSGGLSPGDVDLFVHGFTVSTNAFLMGTGARCVLVTSQGCGDILEIANQLRPRLYSVTTPKVEPVIARTMVVQARERMDSFGDPVIDLDADAIAAVIEAVAARDPEAVAISLMFAHLNPANELRLAQALRQAFPSLPVYLSHEVNPQIEEWPRANTTAIAAYVGPVVAGYLRELEQTLSDCGLRAPLRIMRSDGGVATPESARANPAHTLLSGPAGGVIAGQELGHRLGYENLVTFDMGGTSADFSIIENGEPKTVGQRRIKGQPLRLPTLDVETISSGGGSIAWIDMGGSLKVGPHSAGSVPGPACYPDGGDEPTVTDATVVLGYLDPDSYLDGRLRLDREAAWRAVREKIAEPLGMAVEEAALGIVLISSTIMTQGIRALCVERGIDPRRFLLLAFGGAGPLFARFLARDLNMKGVLVPPNPGVFSAEGLLMSDLRHNVQTPFAARLHDGVRPDAQRCLERMIADMNAALESDGIAPADRRFRRSAGLRYVGQFHEVIVPLEKDGSSDWNARALSAAFNGEHERLYGHAASRTPIEFVSLHVEAIGRVERPQLVNCAVKEEGSFSAKSARPVMFSRDEGFIEAVVYDRRDLPVGCVLAGPAILDQLDSTVAVASDEQIAVLADGSILLSRKEVT